MQDDPQKLRVGLNSALESVHSVPLILGLILIVFYEANDTEGGDWVRRLRIVQLLNAYLAQKHHKLLHEQEHQNQFNLIQRVFIFFLFFLFLFGKSIENIEMDRKALDFDLNALLSYASANVTGFPPSPSNFTVSKVLAFSVYTNICMCVCVCMRFWILIFGLCVEWLVWAWAIEPDV